MTYERANQEASIDPTEVRGVLEADQELDDAITERWREASPAEHGRVLWGLLEFADAVQHGRTSPPKVAPLRHLPRPFAELQSG